MVVHADDRRISGKMAVDSRRAADTGK